VDTTGYGFRRKRRSDYEWRLSPLYKEQPPSGPARLRRNRTRGEIAVFFDDLEWIEPGFVSVLSGAPTPTTPTPLDHFGGVAGKP
jgi:hypothetical protein